MNDTTANAAYGAPIPIQTGPFAGWLTWGAGQDPYETLLGPFCFRVEEDTGAVRAAFQPERRHLNGAGAIHGGCLMSFADFALFSIAHASLKDGVSAVTLTCNSEFLAAGGLDGWIEAHGAVLRETGSLVFVQGRLTQQDRPLLAFSGVLKKLRG